MLQFNVIGINGVEYDVQFRMTVRLRELTSKKNAFLWLEDHEKEFQNVKTLLTSDMIVTHFDPSLPVVIMTDASRLHGLGYAMGHYIDGRFRLVICGSKALTPTQRRYATIELECLAVQYAIDECSFYLKGGPEFTVATDHKPLEGIFKKDLFGIPNPRLQRLREKLVEFSFVVKWVPGKTHHIADALSLAPLFSPEETEDMRVDMARACLATTPGTDDDGHQIQELYPQRNRTKINHKAFERHHSLPTLREANQAAIRHPIKKEIPIRRNTAYSTTSNGGSISQILTTTANIR